jgi:hypothetical protein
MSGGAIRRSRKFIIFTLGMMPFTGTAISAEWNWTSDGLCNYCDQYAAGDARDQTIRMSNASSENFSAGQYRGISAVRLDEIAQTIDSKASPKVVSSAKWNWSGDGLCNYCDQYTLGNAKAAPNLTSYEPIVGYASLSW